jgi:hypothetical protein
VLLSVGYSSGLVLSYDRTTGNPDFTLGDLAASGTGGHHETFHFVLNNQVARDNRIPPYGMNYETARKRNALPVPNTQYGGGPTYNYWDNVTLNPPAGAQWADVTLYYQGTSWEYVQFLWKANSGQNAFLGQEGVNMLDAWINADPAAPMVPPFAMATATWGTPPACTPTEPTEATCNDGVDNDCDGLIDGDDPDCGTGMACTDYADKTSCTNDPNCEWSGSPKNGSCQDKVVCTPTSSDEVGLCGDGVDNDCDGQTDCADTADCGTDPICQVNCSVYTTRNLCNAQTACTWDNKNKVCVNK